MAERVERLLRKRRAVRGSTTRLLQDIESEVGKEDPVVDRLCELLALLSAKEETLLKLDCETEEYTEIEDLENEVANAEEYRERVVSAKARVQRVMQRIRESTNSRPCDTVPLQRGQTMAKAVMEAFPKLPNMEFETTEEEMAEERTAMALELLEASVFDAENNCSMCAKEESPGSALTDWIRCDSCNRWFHVPCVDMDKKQFEHARKAAWDCCLCKA